MVEGFGRSFTDAEKFEIPLKNVNVPTLVIAGRHDLIVPLKGSRKAVKTLPRARLLVLDDSGHCSPEEEPEKVAAAILPFLRSGR